MDRHYNLDKNGKPLPTGNEEPYLSYEELLGLEPLDTEMDKTQELYNTSEEVENKPLEATIIKDNILTPYNDKIDNNPNLTEEEKYAKKLEIAQILENSKANLKEIEKEHLKAQAKNYGKAALDIASMIPVAGGAGLIAKGSGAMAKKLVPTLGRKISQMMGKGMKNGAISGATEGAIKGYLEDENPAITAAQDMAIGTALGTAGSAIGGNIEKAVRGNKLKKQGKLFESKKLNKIEKKDYIKNSNKYYQDYEQGVNTPVKGLGNVKLSSNALKETTMQGTHNSHNVVNLSKDIRNSQYIGPEEPIHNHKYKIKTFHRLKGKNADYQIAENERGDYYFYKIVDSDLTGPKPEGQSLQSSLLNSKDIITDSSPNLNPQVANQTIQAPKSYQDWLDWLRKKRNKNGHKETR